MAPEADTVMVDARLMPRATPVPIPGGGATVPAGTVKLTVPVCAAQSVQVTRLSPQGLRGVHRLAGQRHGRHRGCATAASSNNP